MEVVASLSEGRTAAAQCGLFTHKSVPVIFEPPCISGSLPLLNFDVYVRNSLLTDMSPFKNCKLEILCKI